MSEVVTPEEFTEHYAADAIRVLKAFKDAGLSSREAVALTVSLLDRLYPKASVPLSPDVAMVYERMATVLANMNQELS